MNWVHDLAAANPDYDLLREAESGCSDIKDDVEAVPSPPLLWPWTLLARRNPAIRTVAISEWRAAQFSKLTGSPVDAVVSNGLDPLGFLNLTPRVTAFAAEHRLLDTDVLLLQPARIVRRKNIGLGVRLVTELASRGCRAKLLVTGAPDGPPPGFRRVSSGIAATPGAPGPFRERSLSLRVFSSRKG